MDAVAPPGETNGPGQDCRVTVLGVDPADPRVVAELPRWVPADATGLYRVPALDRRSIVGPNVLENPPRAMGSFLQRLRGTRRSIATLADATSAAASECALPSRTLDPDDVDPPAADGLPGVVGVSPGGWWTAAAWLVTVVAAGVPITTLTLLFLADGLLVWLASALLLIAAGALAVGFALLSDAAAIGHTDAAYAAIAAETLPAESARPVLVVPARNAPGVAAAIRERGVGAATHSVVPGTASAA